MTPLRTAGAISGTAPETGQVPADLDAQCRLMFANVRRVMETAGGTPDDIVKMTVWITDRALRPILNKHWIGMFPDPHSRPAKRRAGNEPALQIESRFVDLFLNLANAG